MSEEYTFEKLTPISDSDLGIYENALDYVFNNDDIRNVAISGAYGAGKSSILESYKAKHQGKRYIHISLAHFSENQPQNEPDTIKESVLEGKILNQLIHQIPAEKIPQTNFKVKQSINRCQLLRSTLTVLFFALAVLLFVFYDRWAKIVNQLEAERVKNILFPFTTANARMIIGVAAVGFAFVLTYKLFKLQRNKGVFRKLSFQGTEIEIFEQSEESYFDKYLNEVLYLFDNVDADVIVFEDMDRFDANRIFERLREVNTLTNLQRGKENKATLRFFYLLRDDLFVSKDRTKFFDYIIPVVPVMDSSNSYNQFISHLKKNNLYEKFDESFLQGLSLYVDDMRLLKNICNEFLIYFNRLNTTELDYNKMLAIITYKNLFPRDYSDLQLNKGFVYSLFQHRDLLIQSEEERIKKDMDDLSSRIERIKNEHLKSLRELDILTEHKRQQANNAYYHSPARDELQRWTTKEYPDRKTALELKEQQGLLTLETQLKGLIEEEKTLRAKKLFELITRDNIDMVFGLTTKNEIGETEDYLDVKGNDYFSLLKYLIRNDFIDETYPDYMTYFYDNSLSRIDKTFLRSVTDKKAKEFAYELKNPKMVFDRLRIVDFEQEETLNYSLFDYIVMYKANSEQATKFVSQLKRDERLDFLEQYIDVTKSVPGLISILSKIWPNYYSIITQNGKMAEVSIRKFIVNLLYYATTEALTTVDSDGVVSRYIMSSPDFLEIENPIIDQLVNSFRTLSICFPAIDYEKSDKQLFEAVYENGLYQMNYVNIKMILQKLYGVDNEILIRKKCCTLVLSEASLPLAKKAKDDIDAFMDVVLSECDESITDDQSIEISILNNEFVSDENKLAYIKRIQTKIDKLEDIENKELWQPMVSYGIITITEKNISDYFDHTGALDDAVISLLNTLSSEDLDFSAYEKMASKDLGDLQDAFVQCDKLDNKVYEHIVNSFNELYITFDFTGISSEKMEILIRSSLIKMNIENLEFMRREYPDQINLFIQQDIATYVKLMNASLINHDELLSVLSMDIDDKYKLALLQFDKAPISLYDIQCSPRIQLYILRNNLDSCDLSKLFRDYSIFDYRVRKLILQLAEENFDSVTSISVSADRSLVDALLKSDHIVKPKKLELLIAYTPSIDKEGMIDYLILLGEESFAKVFDSTARPHFDYTQQNINLLEAFKEKGWIFEYYQEGEIIKIRRNPPRK